ncbi:uncharacterized protein Triagg1_4454 [Trichoderma aggressivum f. europaeum]|uniref:Uncharacterized protein n=1 Tax=Trichoderma aggressivum f. europaeum TaxID=173218 RepID=A0AAE1M5T0_9HYPO|nr:hypothetical protein Triagg1_4454 [Trichoderma aggressivum f. europaeum]
MGDGSLPHHLAPTNELASATHSMLPFVGDSCDGVTKYLYAVPRAQVRRWEFCRVRRVSNALNAPMLGAINGAPMGDYGAAGGRMCTGTSKQKVDGRRGGECSISRAAADVETAMPLHKSHPRLDASMTGALSSSSRVEQPANSTWRRDTHTHTARWLTGSLQVVDNSGKSTYSAISQQACAILAEHEHIKQ